MRVYSQINHLSSLLIFSLVSTFALSSCHKPVRHYAQPTADFPNTWSQEKISLGVHPALPKKRASQSIPQSAQRTFKHPPPPSSAPKGRLTPQQRSYLATLPKTISENSKEIGRIAVLTLDNRTQGAIKQDEMLFLVDEIRRIASYLPQTHFLVMTKESMEVLLDPNTSIEECVGSCEVETGRLIGADWIITGSLFKFGSGMRVSLKLFSTQAGQLLKSVSLKAKSPEELETNLQLETLRLILKLSPYFKQALIDKAGSKLQQQLQFLQKQGSLLTD